MDAFSSLRTALAAVPFRVRIITLGMLSWALCALLPALYSEGAMHGSDAAALALGPLLLVVGSLLGSAQRTAATFLLLTGFPIALSLGASRIAHEQALSMFSPSTLLLAMLSLAAYGSTTLSSFAEATVLRSVEHKPLGEVAQVAPSTRRRQAASALLLVLTVGCLAALAFGASATPAHYRAQWGSAASAGAVVAALGAGIVGCVALAILSPALRAERSEPRADPHRAKRLSWLFLVASSGLIVYVLLR